MERITWRIRGRIQAYGHRIDMLRRSGEWARIQEGAVLAILTGLLSGLCILAARP
ncbi:MAG TPA: hypothetical protein VJV23_10450 [Candidatus Polarisedimenticolia bacterium]|nr:hypothetical protein [Candidatus Polarisedimenticolia bacterium]